MSLERIEIEPITHSIDLARELSVDLEIRKFDDAPSEEEIEAALYVMNQYLWAMKEDIPSTLRAAEAYLDIPDSPTRTIEVFSHIDLEKARIENAIITGKIDSFKWIGSATMQAFGVKIYGAQVRSPKKQHANTAFIPVQGLGSPLVA